MVKYQDLLLDFHRLANCDTKRKVESWQSLVHVCRRWRNLVFGSPRSLNLHVCFGPSQFTRKSLDVWPPLPVLIHGDVTEELVDDVIPGLEHRICHIGLKLRTTSQIEKLPAAMQVPFPELAGLCLSREGWPHPPVLPDSLSFLGGSVPRLRFLDLHDIVFPGSPKLLSSVPHLVHLRLHNISDSGYISPEAMTTCLSTLIGLETLYLDFQPRQSCPDLKSQRPFSPTHTVLPNLKDFQFKGVIKYFEIFVARINAPQLYRLSTKFFDDIVFHDIDFSTPELNQFISCMPIFGTCDEARFIFDRRRDSLLLRLCQSHPEPSDRRMVEVEILSFQQLSTMVRICILSLRPPLTIENLYICEVLYSRFRSRDENTEWLDLLLPFTAVKNLYVSKEFARHIALALQEITRGGRTEVLSTLHNIYLEGSPPSVTVEEGIRQFISARQLTNHPVAISSWRRNDHSDSLQEVN